MRTEQWHLAARTLAVALGLAILGGCGAAKEGFKEGLDEGGGKDPNTAKIERADVGDEWPLIVDSGIVSCWRSEGNSVTFSSGGKIYAVNGTASGQSESQGWLPLEDIWLDDPNIPGAKVNIDPVLSAGLDLCD